ncbi:uncharacterized protein LOC127096022 [Lathyrus oleraceus]|uniref:uncharacterized protein LOC127096022 n=1 Tax=Pisum sativum TaxID=3888 RepID=UPI0021CF048B|nr:uncharacterized protein LOC127096022 [Pisum sativum]
MDLLEKENRELREEVTTLRDMIYEIVSMPVLVAPISVPQHYIPIGFPWDMPPNFVPEGNQPEIPLAQPVMLVPSPVVNVVAYVEEPVFHVDKSETVGVSLRMDEFQVQFKAMHKEIQDLRGKGMFGKNAHDLCLVPHMKISHKLRVLDFEKYKGNFCPMIHLVMYACKISTHIDNHQFLIHYFQDSLSGATLKCYMGLDSTQIQKFNDLGEAFVFQYKYNVDMAPDRDQLHAMSYKEKETFKEYTQRWHEILAQVSPLLEVKRNEKVVFEDV